MANRCSSAVIDNAAPTGLHDVSSLRCPSNARSGCSGGTDIVVTPMVFESNASHHYWDHRNHPKRTIIVDSKPKARTPRSIHTGCQKSGTTVRSSDDIRETLSPSSVLDLIATNTTGSRDRILPSSPLRLNKSRERVQSFLKKTLYQNTGESINQSVTDSSAQHRQDRNSKEGELKSVSPVRAATLKALDGLRQRQPIASASKRKESLQQEKGRAIQGNCGHCDDSDLEGSLSSNFSSGPPLRLPDTRFRFDEDLLENSSVGSTSSASSFPSVGSAGLIGIRQPSYEVTFDSYVYNPLAPPTPASSPNRSTPNTSVNRSQQSSEFTVALGDNTISPKKRFTPSLQVNTSSALAAVFEADQEEEEDYPGSPRGESTGHFLETEAQEEEEISFEEPEGEIVFEERNLSPSTPPRGPNCAEATLFDSPFDSPELEVEEEEDPTFVAATHERDDSTHCRNYLTNVEGTGPSIPASDDTMKSLSRFLARDSKSEMQLPTDEVSRCSASQSSKRSVGRSLKSLGGDMKRKSNELKDKVRRSSSVAGRKTRPKSEANSSSSACSEESNTKNIKIFLLLLEPKTKIFELIQLLYPIRTTTVGDIIRMIPRNATEKKLGNQEYVGLTRPKRRAEPITDLDLLASSYSGKSTMDKMPNVTASAGIGRGNVIIAIPSGCDQKSLVSLGKQILSNPHIQDLVGADATEAKKRVKDLKKKPKCKQDGNPGINLREVTTLADSDKCKKTNYVPAAKSMPADDLDCEVELRGLPADDCVPRSLDVVNSNVFIPVVVEADADHVDRYDMEIQLAVENATRAKVGKDFSPMATVAILISDDQCTRSLASTNTLFPHVDALDAFIFAREERSSSITSRETRTTFDDTDCSTRESYTDTGDEASLTGSLESSFNSWSRSFDSSITSRYHGSVKSSSTNARTVITLSDCTIDETEETSPRVLRKRLSKTLLRFVMCSSVFMILRYFLDSDLGFSSIAACERRAAIPFEPIGFVGFVYSALMFACLVKCQRYMVKKQQHKSSNRFYVSQCPIMSAGSDFLELLANKQ